MKVYYKNLFIKFCSCFILNKKKRKDFRSKNLKYEHFSKKNLKSIESNIMLYLDYKWVYYMPSFYRLERPLNYNYKKLEPIVMGGGGARLDKINFVTFCDSRMKKTAETIKEQAIAQNIYNNVYVCNENHLAQDFIDKMKNKLWYGSRGFGYWSWKPQIILQVLNEMEDGEILIYADAGTQLINTESALANINELVKQVGTSNGIIANEIDTMEYGWTKGDLLKYFDFYDNKNITHTYQRCATQLVILKNNFSINFIKEYRDVISERFDLVCDIPSSTPNLKGFCENRHDQSVFSLLSKKYNCPIQKLLDGYDNPFLHRGNKDKLAKLGKI